MQLKSWRLEWTVILGFNFSQNQRRIAMRLRSDCSLEIIDTLVDWHDTGIILVRITVFSRALWYRMRADAPHTIGL